jgi:hypothetical protein
LQLQRQRQIALLAPNLWTPAGRFRRGSANGKKLLTGNILWHRKCIAAVLALFASTPNRVAESSIWLLAPITALGFDA